ncbi:MAG: EthD domain-containing protein [Novosphingobium sp.]|nr:EthD domain-containing protein [Novosphingobium sp.]MCP5401038.1 EthD domain-containing protein [Novosphingobium sp.]
MAEKAYKILLLMKRKPGMSMEAFKDYYENHHVPLALKYPAANTRYIRRYLEPQPHAESGTNEELPYDVITELWFDDEEIYKSTVEYLATTVMSDEIVNDELNLFDRPTMRMATVVECETDMSKQRSA